MALLRQMQPLVSILALGIGLGLMATVLAQSLRVDLHCLALLRRFWLEQPWD